MPPNTKTVTISLNIGVHERLKDVAFWATGETVSSLLEKGALAYVAQLEAERGSTFPPREGEVRTGRPRKS